MMRRWTVRVLKGAHLSLVIYIWDVPFSYQAPDNSNGEWNHSRAIAPMRCIACICQRALGALGRYSQPLSPTIREVMLSRHRHIYASIWSPIKAWVHVKNTKRQWSCISVGGFDRRLWQAFENHAMSKWQSLWWLLTAFGVPWTGSSGLYYAINEPCCRGLEVVLVGQDHWQWLGFSRVIMIESGLPLMIK